MELCVCLLEIASSHDAFCGAARQLTLLLVSDVVMGYWLALIFQCSHVVGDVAWPLPDNDGKMQWDWGEMQIATTVDYATDSWLWTYITGALNHQTAHHLFPGINQCYYPEITPIVVQTCKDFGISYNYKETFAEALGGHLAHLRDLGQSKGKRI